MEPQQPPVEPKDNEIVSQASKKRPPVFDPTGRVEQLTAQETKIADVRRHPFGLIVIFLQTIIGFALALILIFVLMPGALDALGLTDSGAEALIYLFGFFSIVLAILFLILASRVYNGNQLIFSDVNVTQVSQVGLFNRKVSELSLGNIEDVTARQKGIFPTIFNYGTLVVETAGEQNNFIFRYCPNPNAYARALLDARQHFIMNRHGSH